MRIRIYLSSIGAFLGVVLFSPAVFAANSTETSQSIEAIKYQVGYDTFSNVLSLQTGLFTVIVGLFLGASYLYQRKVTKDEIDKKIAEMKPELEKIIENKMNESMDIVVTKLQSVDSEISIVRGEVYRSMAHFWDSQKNYPTALIWWIRSCSSFCKAGDGRMTRYCLQYARNSVSLIEYGFQVDADSSGEIQNLLKDVDDQIYKAEKELFFEALKETMKKVVKIYTRPTL